MRHAALGALAAGILAWHPPLASQEQSPAQAPPADLASAVALEDDGMVAVEGFAIDRYEYPNQAGRLPRTNVTWDEARDLCRARGKRLCRENEWETACRGPEGHLFGYGPAFESARCNTPYQQEGRWQRQGLARSGAFAECRNGYGLHDMIGNAWEWTATRPGSSHPRALRGGSWFNSVNYARSDARYDRDLPEGYSLDLIGFRCCRDLEAAD